MIRQATTPRAKLRFYNACRGKLCLGATMPLALELLGKSQPGRFFAGPTLALDIGGSTAWMAGHANPEELAGFLTFCGCGAVVLDEAEAAPPAGWTRARTHTIFGLTPGWQLPEPEADEALWASLTFDRDPPARPVAEALLAKGAQLGTILSFMMAVTTLSFPSMVMLGKAVKPRLLGTFAAVCTVGIIFVGYSFNLFQYLFI